METLKRSAVVRDLNRIIDLIPMFRETICGISYTNCGAMGRKPLKDITKFIWDDSNPHVYIYWKDEEKRYIDITAEKPGYEVFAGDDMNNYFHTQNLPFFLEYLDVSHLDVSEVRDFRFCFCGDTSVYGQCFPAKLEGYENWDTSNAKKIDGMFENFIQYTQENKEVHLDLSKWNFDNVETASNAFKKFKYNAKTLEVKLPTWDMRNAVDCSGMFSRFGLNTKSIKIDGFENWKTNPSANLDNFFYMFCPHAEYRLDLSNWWNTDNKPKQMNMFSSSEGAFFNIKLPL